MAPVKCNTFEAGSREAGWRDLRLAVLCIGVGAYAKHGHLANAVKDAEAVYKAVNECEGCRAAIIRDPADKKTIRTHLRTDFLEPLAKSPPALVVIFVAGHGLQHGHHVYLVPTKAASEDETDIEEDCLSHLTVFEWLQKFLDAPAKAMYKCVKFLIIMDVCRVSVHAGIEAQSAPVSIDPKEGQAPEHWALCHSTSRGSVASDGDIGSHSPLVLVCWIHTREYLRLVSLSSRALNKPVSLCAKTRGSVQSPLLST